jgi:hypothetical protein
LKPGLHLPVEGNKHNVIQSLMQQPISFLCMHLQKKNEKTTNKGVINWLAEHKLIRRKQWLVKLAILTNSNVLQFLSPEDETQRLSMRLANL